MKESEEDMFEYFIMLTSNQKDNNSESIVCMIHEAIKQMRKMLMEEDNILVTDNPKRKKEVKYKMSYQRSINFQQIQLIQYVEDQHLKCQSTTNIEI